MVSQEHTTDYCHHKNVALNHWTQLPVGEVFATGLLQFFDEIPESVFL